MSASVVISSCPTFRTGAFILALAALLVLPACWVRSINGLDESGFAAIHADPDLSFDPALLGSWSGTSDDCSITLTITADEKRYKWEMIAVGERCDQDKPKVYYEAQLFKLGGHDFLDVTARSEDVCEACVAVHWIFLTQLEKDSFSLAAIDSDWLKKAVQQKAVVLTTLPGDSDTLTGSAKELKAFCRKYGSDKGVFKPVPDFTFKRK